MKLAHIYRLVYSVPAGDWSFNQIMRQLTKTFSPYPWIKIRRKIVDEGCPKFGVAGLYDPAEGDRGACIITVHFFSKDTKQSLCFRGDTRIKLLFQVFTTIMHERRHFLQSVKASAWPRPFRAKSTDRFGLKLPEIVREMQDYYGSKDEIDAFAYTSALEVTYGLESQKYVSRDRYKVAFSIGDSLYHRFLKKRYKYMLTLPPLDDINRGSRGDYYGRRIG